jgi:hypothetical protein
MLSMKKGYETVKAFLLGVWSYVSYPYRWARQKYRRHQAEKEAYQKLITAMGVDAEVDADVSKSAERTAKRVTSQYAADAAKAAPSVGGESEAIADEVETVEVEIPDPVQTDFENAADPSTMEDVDQVAKEVYRPFQDRDKEDEVTFSDSSTELALAEVMTDASLVPPPRRSEVKKEDLQVRGHWEECPASREEIQRANRMPIVDNQITKTIEHLITSKITITGPEKQADVIRKWFEVEMEYSSGFKIGLNRFVEDVAGQMLRYGISPIFKVRTRSNKKDPYTDPLTGGQRAPVWGYRVPDVSTLQVFIDRHGRPRKWRQAPNLWKSHANEKTYRSRDTHVARLPQRNSSLYFWTPPLVLTVLYAVEVLRNLHDTIESHTANIVDIPSYAKVGDKNYLDGKVTSTMMNQIAKTVRTAKRGHMLILPFHTDIEKHESDSFIDDLKEAEDMWKSIIRQGVGGSKLDQGEPSTSNRNTADSLDQKDIRLAQALVPELQRAFRWLCIDKLMEEIDDFSLDDVQSHDDLVSLEFEEIDLEKQMAREGHIVFKFQNDGMTHGEYRKALGKDPDPEIADKYWSDIQKEKKIEIKKAQKQRAEGQARATGDMYPDHVQGPEHAT